MGVGVGGDACDFGNAVKPFAPWIPVSYDYWLVTPGHHATSFQQVLLLCLPYAWSRPDSRPLGTLGSKRGQRGSWLEWPKKEAQRKEKPAVNWADCRRGGTPMAPSL